MKVKTEREGEIFKPITITIVIESRDELNDLMNRSRIDSQLLIESMKKHNYDNVDIVEKDHSYGLFLKLYEFYK